METIIKLKIDSVKKNMLLVGGVVLVNSINKVYSSPTFQLDSFSIFMTILCIFVWVTLYYNHYRELIILDDVFYFKGGFHSVIEEDLLTAIIKGKKIVTSNKEYNLKNFINADDVLETFRYHKNLIKKPSTFEFPE